MKNFLVSLVFVVVPAALAAIAPPHTDPNGGRVIAVPAVRPAQSMITAGRVVASDGVGFLAAWADASYSGVVGARFDAGGKPVDGNPFLVSAGEQAVSPQIIGGPGEYLTVAGTLVLLSSEGAVKQTGSLPEQYLYLLDGLWTGSVYSLICVSRKVQEETDVVRLINFDAALRVVRDVPIAEMRNGFIQWASVATSGDKIFVTWKEESSKGPQVRGQLFNLIGQPLAPAVTFVQFDPFVSPVTVDVSWNGSSYFVVWSHEKVEAAIVSSAGTITSTLTVTNQKSVGVSIAWDGIAHLIIWSNLTADYKYASRGALFSSTGVDIDWFLIGSPAGGGVASVATNGRVFLAMSSESMMRHPETYVIRSSGNPRVELVTTDTEAYLRQEATALGVGPRNLLAAWTEGGVVYAGRLTTGGDPLDGSGIELNRILPRPFPINSSRPSIAAAGDLFLVTWRDAYTGSLWFARVTADGVLLDPGGVLMEQGGSVPLVASDGESFLVATGPRFAVVNRNGSFRWIPRVFPSTLPQYSRELLWNGSTYSMAWVQILENCWKCVPRAESHIMQVSPDGSLVSDAVVRNNSGLQDIERTDEGLVAIFQDDGLWSQRFTLAGEPVAKPVQVSPRTFNNSFLSRSAAGLIALCQSWPDPAFRSVTAIHLDRFGSPVGTEIPFLAIKSPLLHDVDAGAGGLWLTYSNYWNPFSDTKASGLERSFVRFISSHSRAIARR